ncbi:MAG: hypothetical protein JSW00_16020 [Thermoplasmata archaeon]|nr:MAG: hypothetical protein JSW00_16020 [Thermoplasmata archaeon]
MAGFEIPQNLLLGGGLFILGLLLFVVFYIIVRLIAERKGHTHFDEKKRGEGKVGKNREK